jgi:hypothetical protein
MHADLGRQRRLEELIVSRPHERIVDDIRPLKQSVFEIGPIVGHLVRDAIHNDRVFARLIHARAAQLDVLCDHAGLPIVHFFDERRRPRPFTTNDDSDLEHGFSLYDELANI